MSEGQHEPDEGGDQAGDDDYPLLAGGGDQLGVEAHHERGQPDPGRDEVPGDDEAERDQIGKLVAEQAAESLEAGRLESNSPTLAATAGKPALTFPLRTC